jgi:hypothetical protein
VTASSKHILWAGLLVFLAALIFAGTLVWSTLGKQQSPSAPPSVFSQASATEGAIPHFPAGNINGIITAINGDTLTIEVLTPTTVGSSTPVGTATVIVDAGTQIYRYGAMKSPATYDAEFSAYLTARAQDPSLQSPSPIEQEAVPLSGLTVGMMVNVLPQFDTIQGTTLHADTILIQS